MKKAILLFIVLAINCSYLSCSNESAEIVDNNTESEEGEENHFISEFVYKLYSYNPSSTEVLRDSIQFLLDENKLISGRGVSISNEVQKAVNISFKYNEDRISKYIEIKDQILVKEIIFNYDNDANLSQLEWKFWEELDEIYEFSKSEFEYRGDTIYSKNYWSTDGINYSQASTSKRVLNEYNKLIFHEISGENIYFQNLFYDDNGNLIKKYFNEGDVTFDFTYSAEKNSEFLINQSTYGNQTISLMNKGDYITYNIVSPNVIEGYFRNSDALDLEINTELNENNFVTYSEIITSINGKPYHKTISRYKFN